MAGLTLCRTPLPPEADDVPDDTTLDGLRLDDRQQRCADAALAE